MKLNFFLFALLVSLLSNAAEPWQTALSQMPLAANVSELNESNCVKLMLHSFASNQVVKALIFMPGATDEFYMFHRAKARLTNSPSLLDAVTALTNQTLIRATFYPPLLLLHTDEDPLQPVIVVQHPATAQKFMSARFLPYVLYFDRDWNFIQPILKSRLKSDIRPWRNSQDSWHFYRHSFAAWGLTDWEALEAITLAGKTKCTIQHNRLIFEGDARVRATPKADGALRFPRSAD
jgi:hypothetical protein